MGKICQDRYFFCDNTCKPLSVVALCDGHADCNDGTDETCVKGFRPKDSNQMYHAPTADVITTTVLPTIFGCMLLVAAMLFGIHKCKQYELDRIMEMRRTRRVVQRITERLREKNMKTLEQVRAVRKRRAAFLAQARAEAEQTLSALDTVNEFEGINNMASPYTGGARSTDPLVSTGGVVAPPPPSYDATLTNADDGTGASPPPPYDDTLLEHYYFELFCRNDNDSVGTSGFPSASSWRRQSGRNQAALNGSSRRTSSTSGRSQTTATTSPGSATMARRATNGSATADGTQSARAANGTGTTHTNSNQSFDQCTSVAAGSSKQNAVGPMTRSQSLLSARSLPAKSGSSAGDHLLKTKREGSVLSL